MQIDGKKIVLTGASSGIGKEILKKLQNYDVKIIAVGRNISKIPNYGEKVISFCCDVSKKEEVDKLFEYVIKTFGGVDIFIANAGFAYCEEIQKADWNHIEEIFKTNVISPIYSAEKMKNINIDKEYYTIITCSAVSEVELPGYSLYCSTKHAINGFGRVYKHELRNKGKIGLIYPIATNTNFFKRAGKSSPIPWPVQSPEKVANSVIKGIEKNKKYIYPSKMFFITRILNRIFPFLYPIYVKIQSNKFNNWVEGKDN